jgi:hypothetical protein
MQVVLSTGAYGEQGEQTSVPELSAAPSAPMMCGEVGRVAQRLEQFPWIEVPATFST